MGKWSRASGLGGAAFGLLLAAACGTSSPGSGFGGSSSGSGSSSSSSSSGGSSSSSSGGSSSSSSSGSIFGDGGSGSSSGSVSLDAGCATATATATKTPVYLVFILDGSGSMSQDNKWPAATGALKAIFADMQMKADTGIGVGLIVFSDTLDKTHAKGPYPEPGIDVPINFVGAAQDSALNARLSGQPSSDTPTGTALAGGYGELESYVAMTPLPPGGQKVLVLITDGVPTDNCAQNGGSYTSNACVMDAATELKKAAPAGPILTFVIGTGVYPSTDLTNFDPSFLGNLAEAGGTGPMGCNPNENAAGATDLCYFEVDPTAGSQTQTETAFENAINAIRGQVASCTFPLNVNTEAGTLDPTKVNVTVNGTTVPQSATNGWSYNNPTDPTSITFNGTACTNLKTDANATVQIVLGCETVTAM
jgi:Mg-chelatase subunit ChlD/archaellum component FlaF (FlaF/FlaG flagellin family)